MKHPEYKLQPFRQTKICNGVRIHRELPCYGCGPGLVGLQTGFLDQLSKYDVLKHNIRIM